MYPPAAASSTACTEASASNYGPRPMPDRYHQWQPVRYDRHHRDPVQAPPSDPVSSSADAHHDRDAAVAAEHLQEAFRGPALAEGVRS